MLPVRRLRSVDGIGAGNGYNARLLLEACRLKELILGGARSGKSALAERLAEASGMDVTYVATATAGDLEMAARIRQHQARRPAGWRTLEEPVALARLLAAEAAEGRCILVDCLTLWLSNLLLLEAGVHWLAERDALLQLLPGLPGQLILVSNEVGLGIVPMGELSRRFQDEAGRLHQILARDCDRVILTVAGLPQVLKGETL